MAEKNQTDLLECHVNKLKLIYKDTENNSAVVSFQCTNAEVLVWQAENFLP